MIEAAFIANIASGHKVSDLGIVQFYLTLILVPGKLVDVGSV